VFTLLIGMMNVAHANDNICVVPVYLDTATIPSHLKVDFMSTFWASLSTWNNTGANVRLQFSGTTQDEWKMNAITVRWSDDRGNEPNSAANTYTESASWGGLKSVKIEMVSDQSWCTKDDNLACLDMRNVLIHEFGHALGLDHSKVEDSVMRLGTYLGEPPQHVLDRTDIKNVGALYPPDKGGCIDLDVAFYWGIRRNQLAANN
jgi:hypothetical protein